MNHGDKSRVTLKVPTGKTVHSNTLNFRGSRMKGRKKNPFFYVNAMIGSSGNILIMASAHYWYIIGTENILPRVMWVFFLSVFSSENGSGSGTMLCFIYLSI